MFSKTFQIKEENYSSTVKLLEDLISTILESVYKNTGSNGEANPHDQTRGSGLKSLQQFLQTILSSPIEKRDSSYRVHIEKKLKKNQTSRSAGDRSENSDGRPTYETILHFWCFDPQIRYVQNEN